MQYLYLGLAIICEVIATTALKSADGFTRLQPSLIVAVGYFAAFYMLSLALRSIPIGIAYAIWSGAGIVLISIVALLVHGQKLDVPALIGMGLIVVGVGVIQLFSRATV